MDYTDLLTLQEGIAEVLSDTFTGGLWVKAEVASLSVKGGHCYLELVQGGPSGIVARARAVIWRSAFGQLGAYFREVTGTALESGMEILVLAEVTYHPVYGLSLAVSDINPEFTLGEYRRQRQETIARIEAEGLSGRQKQLPAPWLPYRLAVISSGSAAGYGDFCRHLDGNPWNFGYKTELFEALMQGSAAPQSIIAALEKIRTCGEPFDAVMVMRGGGSELDLACFDDYGLAAAIAAFPVPVYTAIGHDRDFHVADMVAFDYAKTPTALADIMTGISLSRQEEAESLLARIRMAAASRIASMQGQADALMARIQAADPAKLLARGWFIVTDASGRRITSPSSLMKGDGMKVLMRGGVVLCTVNDVKLDGNGEI